MRLRLPRVLRVRPVFAVAVALALAALGGGWLWLRSSSLVAVRRVIVTGVRGPDAGRIRAALVLAGRTMTTLDVQTSKLRSAVSPFAVVKRLEVSTGFPHTLKIRVFEQVPVAVLSAAGERIAVAGDGTVLRDLAPSRSLPTVPVQALPGGSRVTDPQTLRELAVLAAAPLTLLSHVEQASDSAAHGVVVQLRGGPEVFFGEAVRLDAKWLAAAGVLEDPGSAGASYIDVIDPYRPAAGASGQGTATQPSAGSAVQGGVAASVSTTSGG